MSFVLPGNLRELRFTGEAKHLGSNGAAPKADAGPLGKPRARLPPPPLPKRLQTPPPAGFAFPPPPPRAPAKADRVTTPTPSHRVTTPPPGGKRSIAKSGNGSPVTYVPGCGVRPAIESCADELPTQALEREVLHVLPGAKATPKPAPSSPAPIPHFRSASAMARTRFADVTPSSRIRTATSGAPLAIWILAGIVLGMICYRVVPMVIAHFETPSHLTWR
jgi:hypothetical protein